MIGMILTGKKLRSENNDQGWALVEIMIAVILVSVVATSFWSARVRQQVSLFNPIDGSGKYQDIVSTLEDIKNHFGLAGFDMNNNVDPFAIRQGENTDTLVIYHNNVCFQYFLDLQNNLIKTVAGSPRVMAKDISSFKISKSGPDDIQIMVTSQKVENQTTGSSTPLSKSFSAIIKTKDLSGKIN